MEPYPAAAAAAADGARTGGDPRNRDYLSGHLDSTAPAGPEALCFDPQTSGGLLAAVAPEVAADLVDDGPTVERWWRVGHVESGAPLLVLR
jgi:selenide,water dikinase